MGLVYRPNHRITQKELHALLHYNRRTGSFTKNGRAVGSRGKYYTYITLSGRRYAAHELAWFYVYGKWIKGLDHKDTNGHNNAIRNLRKATPHQQQGNRKVRADCKSGFKGVRRYYNKFAARIRMDGKDRHLGLFETPEAAHAVYLQAANSYFGTSFARGI